jgi:hypothetical protein
VVDIKGKGVDGPAVTEASTIKDFPVLEAIMLTSPRGEITRAVLISQAKVVPTFVEMIMGKDLVVDHPTPHLLVKVGQTFVEMIMGQDLVGVPPTLQLLAKVVPAFVEMIMDKDLVVDHPTPHFSAKVVLTFVEMITDKDSVGDHPTLLLFQPWPFPTSYGQNCL